LLLRAAARLQSVSEGKTTDRAEIDQALHFNRKLWTVLAIAATAADNPLPHAIKQNIGNLAIFVLRRTMEVEIDFAAEKLGSIVNINRELAAGLRGAAAAAA
jgi:flagellar protein FlaF